jgi:GNAT superfamily N-acetyltransferase
MIRRCVETDFDQLLEVINDGARAYGGVIPADRYHEPYMTAGELRGEIDSGVVFWGLQDDTELAGIMGIQDVKDVTLIRHAYVRTAGRRRGVGGRLLGHLRDLATRPILIGTWKAADWAVGFYEKHGFELIPEADVPTILRRYWEIPERQIETSVVLAELGWLEGQQR